MQSRSIAPSSAPGPSPGLNSIDSVALRMPFLSISLIFASSALRRIGSDTLSCLHCPGVSSNRLPSDPTNASTEVTSSSRMASSGGLLTWANSCLK